VKSEGQGSGCPTRSCGSAGPEGSELVGVGVPTRSRLGSGAGIPVVRDPAGIPARCGSGSGLEASLAERRVSRCCVGPARPERRA
jgi:hypothetical protein